MNEEFLKGIRSAHFIGIGGIGVSAVARMMIGRGIAVSGSDRAPSVVTEGVAHLGARVAIGHDAKNIPNETSIVIYSPAVPRDNIELVVAREQGIPCYMYPEALGLISKGMRTIAVSGTHGKTTTTAMIAEVLIAAQKSPTVIVGSLLKSGTNFVQGDSDLFVVEACEYKRSFLNLTPNILVITNIDSDHLDYYKDIRDIQNAFNEIAMKVGVSSIIVCNPNDINIAQALVSVSAKIIDYTQEELSLRGQTSNLAVPGDHNIRNAQAALAVARLLGVDHDEAVTTLVGFQGTWRRMEQKGILANGAIVYDDYAHHPTEIKATLQGLRSKFPSNRLRVIFQPHLYSRTKFLLNDFSASFGDADEVIIAPIYAAREEPDPEISAEILAQEIADQKKVPGLRVWAMSDFLAIETYLRDTLEKDDIIITMGAGDIFKVGELLLK